MDEMFQLLSIDNIFFSIFGYSMSYLEFLGTLFNLWSVWLVTRNNVLTWPIGNIGVILFAIMFFQIRLYSDFFEQIYFLITGFYGWWCWLHYRDSSESFKKAKATRPITTNSQKTNLLCFGVIVFGTLIMGYTMKHIHEYFPKLFIEPASLPYLDAFTTVMSFLATILMAHKKIECWYLWISVDVLAIGIYFEKQVIFVSLLYGIFLILATQGFLNWKRQLVSSRDGG